MRNFLASLLCVSTALVSVMGAAKCANPFFTGVIPGIDDIFQGAAPASFPTGSSYCKAFEGKQSCCTSTILSYVGGVGKASKTDLAAKGQGLKLAAKGVAKGAEGESKVADALTAIGDAVDNCLDAIGVYSYGMMCFACTSDWDSYVNTKDNQVKISEGTCSSLVGACSPINTAWIDLIKAIQELSGRDMSTVRDACKGTVGAPGDCKRFVCNTALHGLEVDLDPEERRLTATENSDVDAELRHVTSFMEDIGSHLMSVLHSSPHGRALSATYTNTYSSDGYDAIGVGCKDLGDSKVCSSSNVVLIAVIVASAVAVVVIVVVVVVIVMRRRRGTYV